MLYVVCVVNEPPTFSKTPESVEVLEGSKLELKCVARGKPVPEVTWLRDDDAIEPQNVKTEPKPESFEAKSTLTVPKATLEDESVRYRIEAENSVGKYATHEFAVTGERLRCNSCCKIDVDEER